MKIIFLVPNGRRNFNMAVEISLRPIIPIFPKNPNFEKYIKISVFVRGMLPKASSHDMNPYQHYTREFASWLNNYEFGNCCF